VYDGSWLLLRRTIYVCEIPHGVLMCELLRCDDQVMTPIGSTADSKLTQLRSNFDGVQPQASLSPVSCHNCRVAALNHAR
jgi:hypothetical protein